MGDLKVPSETVLNLATERAIKFLGAVSNNSVITTACGPTWRSDRVDWKTDRRRWLRR